MANLYALTHRVGPPEDPSPLEITARRELKVGDPLIVVDSIYDYLYARAVVVSRAGNVIGTRFIGSTQTHSFRYHQVDDNGLICLMDPDFTFDDSIYTVDREPYKSSRWYLQYVKRREKYMGGPTSGVIDSSFTSGFKRLYQSGRHFDVKVCSSDGFMMPAHRLVLIARSPVWEAEFQFPSDGATATSSASASASASDVPILRVMYPKDVLVVVLDHVYTDSGIPSDVDYAVAHGVFLASDFYSLDGLFVSACNRMGDLITHETVAEISALTVGLLGPQIDQQKEDAKNPNTTKVNSLLKLGKTLEGWIGKNSAPVLRILAKYSGINGSGQDSKSRKRRTSVSTAVASATSVVGVSGSLDEKDDASEPATKKHHSLPPPPKSHT